MLKYIGLAVLFFISVYIGQIISGTYKNSVKQLEAFIHYIKYIKSQVEYYSTSYPDIFNKYTNVTLEQCGFISRLRDSDWNTAIEGTAFSFDNNIKEILCNFGIELGKKMKDDEINNCDYTIEQLRIHYNTLKSELPKKNKLCTSLSLMAGLSTVIILI